MYKRTKISFIPKKPLAIKTERNTRPMSVLLFVSFGIFFISLALFGGLYLYNSNLKVVLEEKTKELEMEKKKADPAGIIEKAEKLQVKINSVKDLLNKHTALSRTFGLLEEVTLENVVLNGLTFEKKEAEQAVVRDEAQTASISNFVIKTSGIAPSYASLAYQSDVLKNEVKENQRIESFLISNPSLDQSGNVSFDIEVSVNPSFLLYEVNGSGATEEILSIEESQPATDQFVSSDQAGLELEVNLNEGGGESSKEKTDTPGVLEGITDFFKKYLGK